jgi:HEAT repeat protein
LLDTDAKSVPDLIRMVREDGSARYAAARALGMMGPKAKDAVPTLVEALNHPSWGIRNEAAEALKTIGPQAPAKAGVR